MDVKIDLSDLPLSKTKKLLDVVAPYAPWSRRVAVLVKDLQTWIKDRGVTVKPETCHRDALVRICKKRGIIT